MPVDRTTIRTVSERSDAVSQRWIPDVLRWTAGLLWLSNVSWKQSPGFGSLGGYFTKGAENQVLPGSSWIFEHVFGPHLTIFGWATVLIEVSLAALLISGRHVRVAAVIGVVQSFGIGLAVANAEGEWYWSYALMIALHLAVLATTSTRPRPSLSSRGLVIAGYGVIVALTHRTAGFTGDENKVFALFDQRNDFPGDFGRNVFPGSILLGLIFIALGLGVAFALPRVAAGHSMVIGWVTLAVSLALLVFVSTPRTEGWLGMRNSSVAMLAVLALTMIDPARRPPDEGYDLAVSADRQPSTTAS